MRRVGGTVVLALAAALAMPACGISEEGGLDPSSEAGVGGGGGSGGGVSNGTCFPGSKVCPDGSGQLKCVEANTPETGCSDATGCTPCPLPHASATCAPSGECLVGQCDAGWKDCNSNPVDGCETNVDGDPSHCGTCENDCKVSQGPNWICEAGGCIVNYCDPGTLLDCDKDKGNGCEVDSNTDVKNCKFCGNACSLAHATNECVGQTCKIQSCDGGWADCDGNEANGCETNIATDPGHCGSCTKTCNSTNGVPGCSGGNCAIMCSGSFDNCDGDVGNGCETDKKQSPSHCGACGNACALAHADQACANGACAIAGCKGGWGDCDGKVTTGCETDLNVDPTHCGSCTQSCSAPANASPACGSGNCGFNCNQSYSTCGAGTTCFNTLTDAQHCGATCKGCPPPPSGSGSPVCNNGNCNVTCSSGFSKCGVDCFNLKTDSSHCGTCTKVCAPPNNGTTSCSNGACVPACPSPLTLCGTNCVNTATAPNNCGGCGKICGGGKVCVASTCVCPTGKQDCGNGVCLSCCGNGDCAGSDKCCGGGVCKPTC